MYSMVSYKFGRHVKEKYTKIRHLYTFQGSIWLKTRFGWCYVIITYHIYLSTLSLRIYMAVLWNSLLAMQEIFEESAQKWSNRHQRKTMIRCVKSLTLQFIISSIKWYAYFIVVRRISALFTNATVKQGCLLSLAFCQLHIDKVGHLIYVFMQQELIEAIIIENT